MKKWQIVLWLLLFFPVGLYLMFMHSDWKKPVKYGIIGFFVLAMFLGGVELWSNLFYIGSFFAMIVGLFTVFRKRTRRSGLMALILGILVFAVASPMVDEQIAERARLEQIEVEAQEKADRLAEEERLEEIARQEEEERLAEKKQRSEEKKQRAEEARKLTAKIVKAIEIVEEYPTQSNYDEALKLLDRLERDSVLATRLEALKPDVTAYEEELASAEEAVEQAETEKDRITYDEAYELVSALSVSNNSLTRRLDQLDVEITKVEEEERIAAERAAEEERKAAEAEAERIAAEQEAQRQATATQQQASSGSSSSGSSNKSSSNTGGSTAQTPAQTPAPASEAQAGQYVDENGNGLIKGSRNGIYHVPGSTYYSRTTSPVAWFKTVQEAVNAGYRAPKR